MYSDNNPQLLVLGHSKLVAGQGELVAMMELLVSVSAGEDTLRAAVTDTHYRGQQLWNAPVRQQYLENGFHICCCDPIIN